jgi:hypothetical protein
MKLVDFLKENNVGEHVSVLLDVNGSLVQIEGAVEVQEGTVGLRQPRSVGMMMGPGGKPIPVTSPESVTVIPDHLSWDQVVWLKVNVETQEEALRAYQGQESNLVVPKINPGTGFAPR